MVDLRDLFQGLGDLGFRTLGPHASESCVQAFFACVAEAKYPVPKSGKDKNHPSVFCSWAQASCEPRRARQSTLLWTYTETRRPYAKPQRTGT